MAGSTPTVEPARPETGTEIGSGLLWWEQPFQPMTDAAIWVGASQEAWSGIGSLVLTAAGVEDSTAEGLRGTFLEVVQQALSGVAQSLAGLVQADVRCEGGAERSQPPPGDLFPVIVRFQNREPIGLALAFSTGLAKWSPGGQADSAAPPGADIAPAVLASEEPDTTRTIDLLYDVELPVSVSFGRAHLALKEVLKLTSGSIVELNRTVSEPVEVIVNNCVIARGDVVVVDGNYGVRINQILSRRERLRTLY
jgi:flagellar motor switch protein FliN/FliY